MTDREHLTPEQVRLQGLIIGQLNRFWRSRSQITEASRAVVMELWPLLEEVADIPRHRDGSPLYCPTCGGEWKLLPRVDE